MSGRTPVARHDEAGWRETVYHDGAGLQHRPAPGPGWIERVRLTAEDRERLVRLTDEADALAGRLRSRAVRAEPYDARLVRLCGRAEARLVRRIWLGRRPAYLVAG